MIQVSHIHKIELISWKSCKIIRAICHKIEVIERQCIILYVHNKCVKSLYFLRAEVQHRLHQDQDYPCEVVGSWNTWYGEQDQAGKEQCSSKQKT